MKKKDIRTLSESELEDFFEHHSLKPFHGKQVYHWLWKKGVHSFDEMTNISNSSKELLGASFVINHINTNRETEQRRCAQHATHPQHKEQGAGEQKARERCVCQQSHTRKRVSD